MSLMSVISSLVKRPHPDESAKKIVDACFASVPIIRYGHFMDKFLDFVGGRARYEGSYYDGSRDRVRPLALAAALAYIYLRAHNDSRTFCILNELKGRILDVAQKITHDSDLSLKFHKCEGFVLSEMHTLPIEVEKRIRICTLVTEDFQRIHECAANWLVQQIRNGKAEHYIDLDRSAIPHLQDPLSQAGNHYITEAYIVVDDVIRELYMININDWW